MSTDGKPPVAIGHNSFGDVSDSKDAPRHRTATIYDADGRTTLQPMPGSRHSTSARIAAWTGGRPGGRRT